MEAQTPPSSQSLAGYPTSASGGIPVPALPEGLRSGAYQDVPDAISNPVEPASGVRPAPAAVVKRPSRALPITLTILVLLVIIIVAIFTGFFGMM